MLRVLRMAADEGIAAWGSPTRTSPIERDPAGQVDATIHELGALAYYFLDRRRRPSAARLARDRAEIAPWNPISLLAMGDWPRILCQNPPITGPPEPPAVAAPTPRSPVPRIRERESVKQAEEASFVDLIACERDCRTCSYAAALDCDGNCGVCPHNGYCPCVNPVVARSKTALRLIELRPILLQDLRVRN